MFSLRVKTDLAREDLSKISEDAGRESVADAMEKVRLSFMAGAVKLRGFTKIDMEHFTPTLGNL